MFKSQTICNVFVILKSITISVLFIGGNHADLREAVRFETEFISDPQKSSFKENFIRIPINDTGPLSAFTFCFRVKLSTTITQCLFQQDGFGFKFDTEDYGFLTLHNAWIMFDYKERLDPMKWYHVCMSYDSAHILLIINDKILLNEESCDLMRLKEPTLVLSDQLTLGFCIGDHGIVDPLGAITRGVMTDFNLWSQSFSKETLLGFTKNCLPLSDSPDVINWSNLKTATKGDNAEILTLGLNDVCGKKYSKDTTKTHVVIPIRKTYESAKKLCKGLGGEFPMFRNALDIESWNETFQSEKRYDGPDKNRNIHTCGHALWAPIRQNGMRNGSSW